MNRNLRKMLGMILSVAVIGSGMSIPVYAAVSGSGSGWSGFEYKDGEAIVILESEYAKKVADMTEDEAQAALKLGKGVAVESVEKLGSYEDAIRDSKLVPEGKTVYATGLVVSSDTLSTEQLVNKLSSSSKVKYAIPNIRVKAMGLTNDTYADSQWGLEDVDAEDLWESTKGTDKVVAVVDTGVLYTHEDLDGVIWNNPVSARLDGKHGYDFVNSDKDPKDDNGHGSHVAGIIGAEGNNGAGISGVNQKVKIMALKVLDEEGSGYLDDIMSAYGYISAAQDLGVDVVAINNSWGLEVSDDDLMGDSDEMAAVNEVFGQLMDVTGSKGALSVIAAGNSSSDLANSLVIPAEADTEYKIVVAATNEDGSLAAYSNYGSKGVDLAAPGSEILSTVCYDSFLPSVYSKAQLDATAMSMETFESDYSLDDILIFDKNTENGVKISDYEGKASVSLSSDRAYSGTKSLKVSVPDVIEDESLVIGIPVNLKGQKNPYMSVMYQALSGNDETQMAFFSAVEGTKDMTYKKILAAAGSSSLDMVALSDYKVWDHGTAKLKGGKNEAYLYIICSPWADGDYTLYIDDLAFSKSGTDSVVAKFGKYDIYSGTSMAAPHVTGAAALVENYLSSSLEEQMEPAERALAVKSAMVDNVRSVSGLKDKVSTGGTLSLKNISSVPVISSMKASSDKLTLKGKSFIGTAVTVNGKEVEPSIGTDGKSMTIKGKYANKTVTVIVKNEFGKAKKKAYLLSDKNRYSSMKAKLSSLDDVADYRLFSDGKKLYAAGTSMGGIYIYEYNQDTREFEVATFDEITFDEGSAAAIITEPVVANGYVYMLAASTKEMDTEGEMVLDYSFLHDYKLVGFKLSGYASKTQVKKALPSSYDNITGEALGAYNGKIYVLGGYDYGKEKPSKKVSVYNPATKKWSSAPALPEGRLGGRAVQSGGFLYYTMGANEAGKLPKILVYNGSKWTMKKTQLVSHDYTEVTISDSKLKYYDGNVSLIKGGILMNGIRFEGYGDTLKYSNGKFKASKVNFMTKASDQIQTVTAGSAMYSIGTNNKGTKMYKMSCASGLVKATGSVKHGKVTNLNKSYLPGTTVKYTVKPAKGYKVKIFTVDGKKVKGASKTIVLKKNIKVKASFEKVAKKSKKKKK